MLTKLPLLQKELFTYATKKRLHLVRFIYGLVLYTVFLHIWSSITHIHKDFHLLGKGLRLMHVICTINVIGILCLVPGVCATVITREKERKTLPLLLVCPLYRSQILFEKYVVIFFTSVSLLMMSIPIISLSYLMGGITSSHILLCLYSQTLTLVQVIAIGIFCSCYFRTSILSTITTYVLAFFLYLFLPLTMHSNFKDIAYFLNSSFLFLVKNPTLSDVYFSTSLNWIFSASLILLAAKMFSMPDINTLRRRKVKPSTDSLGNFPTLTRLYQKIMAKEHAHFSPSKYLHSAILSLVVIAIVVFIAIIVRDRQQNIIKGNLFDVYAIIFLVMFGFCTFLLLKIPHLRTPILWLEYRSASLSSRAKRIVYFFLFFLTISHMFFARYSSFYYFVIWLTLLTIVTKSAYLLHKDIIKERSILLRTTPLGIVEILWQKIIYITRYTLLCAFIISILLPFYYQNSPQYPRISSYILVYANAWGHYFLWAFTGFVLWQFLAMALGSFFRKSNHIAFGVALLLFLSLTPIGPTEFIDFIYTSWVFPYNYQNHYRYNYNYTILFNNKLWTFLYALLIIFGCSALTLYNFYRQTCSTKFKKRKLKVSIAGGVIAL